MESETYLGVGIALGLGFLVGLERERSEKPIGGIRTFPLITLFGAFCGFLGAQHGAWVPAAGLVSLAAILVAGDVARMRYAEFRGSITTESAALIMYLVGILAVSGYTGPAVVAGGTVAVLLQWKRPLHAFVRNIEEEELHALMRMVLIGLVILPVLPNQSYGPYDVLNPFQIWLMVVLIVGISLGAYVVYKLLGTHVGVILGGILGGLISSTATTVSYARLSRSRPTVSAMAALVIMLASCVVFVRVLIEIGVAAPSQLAYMAPPLAVMMAFLAVLAAATYGYVVWRGRMDVPPAEQPPQELTAAITFGLMYGVVLVAVAFAQDKLGDRGLYFVAGLSGLTDMDAITLSTARMAAQGEIDVALSWRMVLVGAMANLVFKGLAVAALGSRQLLGIVALLFAIALVFGGGLLAVWPD